MVVNYCIVCVINFFVFFIWYYHEKNVTLP